jgi:hypothetical protein
MAHWFRVWHTKHKPAAYLSHLDLMRFWERAVRRSGLPIAFSQGFNKHPKLSSPMALGVAIESDRELVEIALEALPPIALNEASDADPFASPASQDATGDAEHLVREGEANSEGAGAPSDGAAAPSGQPPTIEQVRDAFAKQMIDGVAIVDVEYVGEGTKRALVSEVTYRFTVTPDVFAAHATQPHLDALMAAPWHTDRKRGSGKGRSELDVRPRVAALTADPENHAVDLAIRAVDNALLRPRDLIDALSIPWAPESGIAIRKTHMALVSREASAPYDEAADGEPEPTSESQHRTEARSADEPLAALRAPSDFPSGQHDDPSP